MTLQIFTIKERPELRASIFSEQFQKLLWPEFMMHDSNDWLYFQPPFFDRYLDFAFVGIEDGEVVARAFSVPFVFNIANRNELPDGGWDEVIRWAHADQFLGRKPNVVSALEISLLPQVRGKGYSRLILEAMKKNAYEHGYTDLFVPVRPNQKHNQPYRPIAEYVNLRRSDGLLEDQWLRVHVRAGGKIIKIAPYAMTIVGTVSEWSQWTGMTFDKSGLFPVDGALSPIYISIEQDYGVYIEPSVWIHHALS
jgi:GNAT superfamily N-acetyltransferase